MNTQRFIEEDEKEQIALLLYEVGILSLDRKDFYQPRVDLLYKAGLRIVKPATPVKITDSSFTSMPRPVPKPSQTKKVRGKKTIDVLDDG